MQTTLHVESTDSQGGGVKPKTGGRRAGILESSANSSGGAT